MTGDRIVPAGLSDLVDRLVSDGAPAAPVRLAWRLRMERLADGAVGGGVEHGRVGAEVADHGEVAGVQVGRR